jgi:hypothetical protein
MMVEPSKITEKATELASQAAAAAAPLADKARELAETAATAAAPLANQAKDRVAGIADRAGELGAKGVSAVAEGLDAVTRGKFSDQISAVTSRIEDALDPDDPTAGPTVTGS